MSVLFKTARNLIVASLVSLCAASGALALDKLVQRDLDAFQSFVLVRSESLEAAIARRDVTEARSIATRIHEEECRFLERVVRYLRDARNPSVASELESYLADYRQISLKDSVRMRRHAGPGHVPLHELASAALTGTRVPASSFMVPHGAEGAPPAAPQPQYPVQQHGTPVPSLPAAITTAGRLQPRVSAKVLGILKADLSDQDPLLASTKARSVNLDGLRGHTGAGGAVPAVSISVGDPIAVEGDGALASSIRVPGASSGSTGSTGSGTHVTKAPAAVRQVPAAPVTTKLALPVNLRGGR